MNTNRRAILAAGAAWGTLPTLARAQGSGTTGGTIRLGVISDMAGPYGDLAGPGSVQAVRQAVQEAAGLGLKVEIVSGDHQNRPDLASNLARQWFDRENVDALIDVPGSSAGLAVASIAREKNKVFLASAPGTAELTGAQCSPNTVHWTYDTWMLAHSTGGALVKAGGDSWYFITVDYAFGHSVEAETTRFVQAAGGRVLGSSRFPFPGTTDFSAFLLRAQASRAKVVALGCGGADLINAVKQAAEFGLARRGQRVAALLMFISDVHAMGLGAAQGSVCSETFYWDMNERTRAFSARMRANHGMGAPTMVHAGCYAATLHYLKAVADMGVAQAKADGGAAVARMKAMPADDDAFGPGRLRADGRKLHPYLSVRGKGSGRKPRPLRLLQAAGHHPGRAGLPPGSRGRLRDAAELKPRLRYT